MNRFFRKPDAGLRKTRRPVSPSEPECEGQDCRQKIFLSETLHRDADAVLEALQAVPAGRIYLRGGALVRLADTQRGGEARCEPLDPEGMRRAVSEAAVCLKQSGSALYETYPPMAVIRAAMAHPELGLYFKPLAGVIRHPIISADGSVVCTGYDPLSRFYVDAPGELALAACAVKNPSEAETAQAARILADLFADFPFVSGSDKAHSIALLLTLLCRPLIQGDVPAFFIHAPAQGSGKSLLAKAVLSAASGRPDVKAFPDTEAELGKELLASLIRGDEYIFFDNVSGKVKSPALCAAITAGRFSGRVLGRSEVVSFDVACPFIFTGNNAELSKDIARRTVSIGLDARTERPWERDLSAFRTPDLLGHIRENRAALLQAALTIARAWVLKAPEAPGRNLGGFEKWSAVAGGILRNAGIPGFLENAGEFYESADTETAGWAAFVQLWREKFPEPVPAKDLAPLAAEAELVTDARKDAFPYLLRKKKDCVFAGFRICHERAGRQRARLWSLDPVT